MKRFLLSALVLMSVSAVANATSTPYYASFKFGVADTKLKSSSLDTKSNLPITQQEAIDLGLNSNVFNLSNQFSGESKTTVPVSLAVGYDFAENYNFDVRGELEYTYTSDKKFNTKSGNHAQSNYGDIAIPNQLTLQHKIQTNTFMANAYYDFKNSTDFTPFISGGLGFTHLKSKALFDDQGYDKFSKDSFSWSVGAGVSYAVSRSTDLELAYKYVDLGKFDLKTNSVAYQFSDGLELGGNTTQKLKLHSNQVTFGIRHKF